MLAVQGQWWPGRGPLLRGHPLRNRPGGSAGLCPLRTVAVGGPAYEPGSAVPEGNGALGVTHPAADSGRGTRSGHPVTSAPPEALPVSGPPHPDGALYAAGCGQALPGDQCPCPQSPSREPGKAAFTWVPPKDGLKIPLSHAVIPSAPSAGPAASEPALPVPGAISFTTGSQPWSQHEHSQSPRE